MSYIYTMNGDGGSDQNGVDGQNISPNSVTTGEVKTTDLTFTIARQADTLFGATNYVLPISKPPEDGSTYALCNSVDAGGLFVTPSVNATFSINLTTGANAQTVNVTFQPNTSFPIDIILSSINNAIANWFSSVFSPSLVVLSLNTSAFPYSTDIFVSSAAASGQILNAGGTQHQVATFLGWPATSPAYAGINTFTSPIINTVTQIIEIDNLCIWKKIPTVYDTTTNKIESYDASTGIICQDAGSIQSFGNVNYNDGNLSQVGSIAGTATCNVTTSTTQIANGSSEIKLIADSVDRLVINATNTNLSTKSILTGPQASFVNLNDNGQFSIGSLGANNGIIDSGVGNLAIVGAGATSAIELVLAPPSIVTSVFNGGVRTTRQIIDQTSSTMYDANFSEKLKIDTSGVTVNNAYSLPTTTGAIGEVLTRGIGVTSLWKMPQIIGRYSQTSPQPVANTTVETTLIGAGVGSMTIPANYFTAGMAHSFTSSGTFRNNANNTVFRFRMRASGGVVIFDSGLLSLMNISLVIPYRITITHVYTGGTGMVTSFNFSYNLADTFARGFTNQTITSTFDPTIANTFDLTCQWSVASVNNTITSNIGIWDKFY